MQEEPDDDLFQVPGDSDDARGPDSDIEEPDSQQARWHIDDSSEHDSDGERRDGEASDVEDVPDDELQPPDDAAVPEGDPPAVDDDGYASSTDGNGMPPPRDPRSFEQELPPDEFRQPVGPMDANDLGLEFIALMARHKVSKEAIRLAWSWAFRHSEHLVNVTRSKLKPPCMKTIRNRIWLPATRISVHGFDLVKKKNLDTVLLDSYPVGKFADKRKYEVQWTESYVEVSSVY